MPAASFRSTSRGPGRLSCQVVPPTPSLPPGNPSIYRHVFPKRFSNGWLLWLRKPRLRCQIAWETPLAVFSAMFPLFFARQSIQRVRWLGTYIPCQSRWPYGVSGIKAL